jgi:hypothetical protein
VISIPGLSGLQPASPLKLIQRIRWFGAHQAGSQQPLKLFGQRDKPSSIIERRILAHPLSDHHGEQPQRRIELAGLAQCPLSDLGQPVRLSCPFGQVARNTKNGPTSAFAESGSTPAAAIRRLRALSLAGRAPSTSTGRALGLKRLATVLTDPFLDHLATFHDQIGFTGI